MRQAAEPCTARRCRPGYLEASDSEDAVDSEYRHTPILGNVVVDTLATRSQ